MLYIKESDVKPLVQKAFELSKPQGLGFLHFNSDDTLSEDDLNQIICPKTQEVHMDYVKGRAVKFSINRDNKGLYINDKRWYDHSDNALMELLSCI